MKKSYSPQPRKNEKRINEAIMAREISVISDEWASLGILSRDEALRKAEELGVDLVEMSIKDGVAVAKLVDYGKYLFRQQKQQSHNKSQSKKTEIKTLKLTYKIGDHDLDVKRTQATNWAKDGHPLKLMLQLRGRENQYEDLARGKINEFMASLDDSYKIDPTNKVLKQGNTFNITLYPKK